jgi:hypothetical protein
MAAITRLPRSWSWSRYWGIPKLSQWRSRHSPKAAIGELISQDLRGDAAGDKENRSGGRVSRRIFPDLAEWRDNNLIFRRPLAAPDSRYRLRSKRVARHSAGETPSH